MPVAIEFNHTVIQGTPWLGYTESYNFFSFFLIPLWLGAVAGLWIDAWFAKTLLLLGLLCLLSQTVILAAGGNAWPTTLPYLVSFLAALAGSALGHTVIGRQIETPVAYPEDLKRAG